MNFKQDENVLYKHNDLIHIIGSCLLFSETSRQSLGKKSEKIRY